MTKLQIVLGKRVWLKSIVGLLIVTAFVWRTPHAHGQGNNQPLRVLVFSKVGSGAFTHDSINSGIVALREIGQSRGWVVDDTIDAGQFSTDNLSKYDVVVFNNTAGDVLDSSQQFAFEKFIQYGGGYVGIHAASDTEYNWPWYGDLVGAYFKRHPPGTPTATLHIAPTTHPATRGLPNPWGWSDEWYEWQTNPRAKEGMQILLTVDESTYSGGQMGADHPIAWCREFGGGRSFFTGLGHPADNYSDSNFRNHIAGGIEWAAATPLIFVPGLILDLDADKGLTLEDSDRVSNWKNQISDFIAQDFVKRDPGRSIPGSGRPILKSQLATLNGHNSLIFREHELVNMEEDAFDHLITGSGHTWFIVMAPYSQTGRLPDVNVFLGNLRNGGNFEGLWAGLEDNNTLWWGPRNAITFGRFDINNPKLIGPLLQENHYHILIGRLATGTGTVQAELFVDSTTPVTSASFPVNPSANSSKLAIGTERDAIDHPGKESFNGEISRILIYERGLSDTELSQTFDALTQIYLGNTSAPASPSRLRLSIR